MLRKGVYLCEYMNDWETFNETKLSEREEFYSNLHMEHILEMQITCMPKEFLMTLKWNLSEYQVSYLKSDTLILDDIFEDFRIMCLKIYDSNPVIFFSAPGLAWQAALKKTEVS